MAQINCTVGDLEGNFQKIKAWIKKAEDLNLDVIAFPELAITGYPPEDLLLKPRFIQDNLKKIRELAPFVKKTAAIVGFVDKEGSHIYNSAALIKGGKIVGVYRKMCLPNYGVFDEKRYFLPGQKLLVFKIGKITAGINICEDIWEESGPTRALGKRGTKIVFTINGSPYHQGKIRQREEIVKDQAKANKIAVVYINLVGGQDELVFDGQSMVVDSKGLVVSRAKAFVEELLVVEIDATGSKLKFKSSKLESLFLEEEVYKALLLGLGDYVRKNGFKKVVVGLSGGIDSSLVATLAVDALGKDNVTGVVMPSRFSSLLSKEDAESLAKNLRIKLMIVSIEPIFKAYLETLNPQIQDLEQDIAMENIQARIRGNILMAFSNKFNWLVLTTGNKSEMSVGYATLYGDMAGGFAPIKDIPKTLVYKLARYRNSLAEPVTARRERLAEHSATSRVIPESVLVKEPSAELRLNQKDRDSLPPYEILDPILKLYVEQDLGVDRILKLGFEKEVVSKVAGMVDKSEYKRRQSPPGIKITPKAFGKDRRVPITNKYGK
ncbi:MAG: NAD+ synthase (glutamine-hydrolysing) [Parcubacteria group bacterium Gr01-1014_30]|nr:MAG: NAD+ synthase (glutamine-hydrolysing) [Parcubacteria group bacterium Gr01-1014_30]